MGPFVLHDALRGEVEDAGVSAQCEALPERVLKGLDKGKSMDHHGLADIGQQVHGAHRRQALSIEC